MENGIIIAVDPVSSWRMTPDLSYSQCLGLVPIRRFSNWNGKFLRTQRGWPIGTNIRQIFIFLIEVYVVFCYGHADCRIVFMAELPHILIFISENTENKNTHYQNDIKFLMFSVAFEHGVQRYKVLFRLSLFRTFAAKFEQLL